MSQSDEPRIWATRDHSKPEPPVRTFARRMRVEPTEAERLWWQLRHRLRTNASHFRRQVRIGSYVVDFANHRARLIVEVDGGQHASTIESDAERTRFLESEGYRVLRFWNNDVLNNTDGVLDAIAAALAANTPTPDPSPRRGPRGGSAAGCPGGGERYRREQSGRD